MHHKWRIRIMIAAQIILAAAITVLSMFLVFHYAQYGQNRNGKPTSAPGRQTEEAKNILQGESRNEQAGENGKEIPGELPNQPEANSQAVSTGNSSNQPDADSQAVSTGNLSNQPKAIPQEVRIRILTDDFVENVHDEVVLSCEASFQTIQVDFDDFAARNVAVVKQKQTEAFGTEKQSPNQQEASGTGKQSPELQEISGAEEQSPEQTEVSGTEKQSPELQEVSRPQEQSPEPQEESEPDNQQEYGTANQPRQEYEGREYEGREYDAEAVFQISFAQMQPEQVICVESLDGKPLRLESIRRGGGVPQYGGRIYLVAEADGIAVINELPLEKYLYSVVSSEMPSDYPLEALKAQAVCARTYAVNSIRNNRTATGYEDLDDSVSFQVYNNYASTKKSRKAVKETAGEIMPLTDIQYYSTSCQSIGRDDLYEEERFRAFIEEEPEAGAEYGSPWLRWTAAVPWQVIAENLQIDLPEDTDRASPEDSGAANPEDSGAANPEAPGAVSREDSGAEILPDVDAAAIEDTGTVMIPDSGTEIPSARQEGLHETESEMAAAPIGITDIVRRGDGQIQSLTITAGGETFTIEGEYQVRKALGSLSLEYDLQDGTTASKMQILPSAFFYIEETESGFLIKGGGYGHGNGMSQYGAAAMAEEGLDYRAILRYYYNIEM